MCDECDIWSGLDDQTGNDNVERVRSNWPTESIWATNGAISLGVNSKSHLILCTLNLRKLPWNGKSRDQGQWPVWDSSRNKTINRWNGNKFLNGKHVRLNFFLLNFSARQKRSRLNAGKLPLCLLEFSSLLVIFPQATLLPRVEWDSRNGNPGMNKKN